MKNPNLFFVGTVNEIAILAQYHDDAKTVISYFPALMLGEAKPVTNFGSAQDLMRLAKNKHSYEETVAFCQGYSACLNTGTQSVMPQDWKYGSLKPDTVSVPTFEQWLQMRQTSNDTRLFYPSTFYNFVFMLHGLTPVVA